MPRGAARTGRWLSREGEGAAAADEVARRLREAVGPAAHEGESRAGEHLAHALARQVPHHVLGVVVLAAEDDLALRRDVEVLEGARAQVVAAAEPLAAGGGFEADLEVAGAVHHLERLDREAAPREARRDLGEVAPVVVVAGA